MPREPRIHPAGCRCPVCRRRRSGVPRASLLSRLPPRAFVALVIALMLAAAIAGLALLKSPLP